MEEVETDRRITDPWDNAPFLEWYNGIFDAVFIVLHPFLTIPNIDPGDAPRSVVVIDRRELPPQPLTLDQVVEKKDNYMKKFDIDLKTLHLQEKLRGEKVSWRYVQESCGFDSLASVNVALKTGIMSLKEIYSRPSDAEHLEAFCAKNKIFLPTEDVLPPILQHQIGKLLQRLKIKDVTVSDEFNLHAAKIKTEQLITDKPWQWSDLWKFRANKIYPEDHQLLLITPFDNFYTALCGDREQLNSLKVDEALEGFWCDDRTRLDWWQS